MNPCYFTLEVRDCAEGLECRLLQGNGLDGPDCWDELVGWQAFPLPADTLQWSGQARLASSAGGANASLQQINDALWNSLPAPVSRNIAARAMGAPSEPQTQHEIRKSQFDQASLPAPAPDAPRVFLRLLSDNAATARVGGSGPRAADLHALLWEAWTPIRRGRVAWCRVLQQDQSSGDADEAIELDPLRVLVLIGSLQGAEEAQRLEAATGAISTTRKQLLDQGLAECVHLHVAVPACYQNSFRGNGVKVYRNQTELRALLAHGTPASAGSRTQSLPYHVLVVFSHSDHDAADGSARPPTGLVFSLDEGPVAMPAQELAQLLPSTLKVLLLMNCASAAFAPQLLRCADQVLAMHPIVEAEVAALYWMDLFRCLAADVTVAEAARAARGRGQGSSGWMLGHFARSRADAAFLSRESVALKKFHERVYTPERRMQIRFGKRRQFDFRDMHVELQIAISEESGKGARPAEGPAVPPRSGSVTFRSLLGLSHRRWQLRGDPGGGKTTSLRACALKPPPGHFVLYSSLPAWAAKARHFSVDAFCRDCCPDGIDKDVFVGAVNRREENGTLVVLLDAYDELDQNQRPRANKLLNVLKDKWPRAAVVVAARTATDMPLDEGLWQRAVVQPMATAEQQAFLEKWLAGADGVDPQNVARAAVDVIAEGGHRMQEMASNPLLLTFLGDCILTHLEAKPAPSDPSDFAWLGRLRRHDILEKLLQAYLEGAYTHQERRQEAASVAGDQIEDVRTILRRVAWWMTCLHKARLPEAELREILFSDKWRSGASIAGGAKLDGVSWPNLKQQGRWSEKNFLGVLQDHVGVLRPDPGSDPVQWAFSHRHLQEALAAEYWWYVVLAEGTGEDLAGRVQQAVASALATNPKDAPDFWTEPVALLAERLPDGDRLPLSLLRVEATLPMGLRVLEALERVQPPAVENILKDLPPWSSEQRAIDGQLAIERALDLLPDRVRKKDAEAVLQHLAAHGRSSNARLDEVGAIVACMERLARRLGLDDTARQWVDQIVGGARFGRLTAGKVQEFFRGVPLPRGQLLHIWKELWCPIPPTDDFLMGSPATERGHDEAESQVRVSLPAYWMQATTVTVQQFALFHKVKCRESQPMPATHVSWYVALLFARWLDHERRRPELREAWAFLPEGMFDLPSEARWEWAARGGNRDTRFWRGDKEEDLARVGWYDRNTDRVHSVAELPCNAYGLFDVHGNVVEWCKDTYGERLPGGDDPLVDSPSARRRAIRGGSYGLVAGDCRAAYRFRSLPGGRNRFLGFRLLLGPPPPARASIIGS